MRLFGLSTRDNCIISLCAAVIAIMAQIMIPLPLGVPVTLQTFAIVLSGIILGSKKGVFTVLVYLLLGTVGLPVFHGFTGGIQAFVSPTGGFLLSFPIMAWFSGQSASKFCQSKGQFVINLFAGVSLNLLAGMFIFKFLTDCTLTAAFAACILPFLPTTVIQVVLGAVIGLRIRRQLVYII